MSNLTNRESNWRASRKGFWKKEEDELILNKWGLGMDKLRQLMPHKTSSDIFGRRIYLLKKKGVKKV